MREAAPKRRWTWLAAALLSIALEAGAAEPLIAYPNAQLVEADYNDADSFRVRFDKEGKATEEVIRLYFIDTPETTFSTESDLRRIREQARYFGLEEERKKLVVEFGEKARAAVEKHLANPFTIYTAYARAQGRSRKPRIYAMVETSKAEDLAKLLVESGLARAKGIGRQLPSGTPAAEYKAFLEDLEMVAGLKKSGIWAATDTDRIAELRKLQRDEERELQKGLAFGVFSTISEDEPLDLNAATAEELQQLHGIGPELADRIVKEQPYEKVEDLTRVHGIGPVTLEKISRFLVVDP